MTISYASSYTAGMPITRTLSFVACTVSLVSPVHGRARPDIKICLAGTRVRYADALS